MSLLRDFLFNLAVMVAIVVCLTLLFGQTVHVVTVLGTVLIAAIAAALARHYRQDHSANRPSSGKGWTVKKLRALRKIVLTLGGLCMIVYALTLLFAVSAPTDLGVRYAEFAFAVGLLSMLGMFGLALVAVVVQMILSFKRSPKHG